MSRSTPAEPADASTELVTFGEAMLRLSPPGEERLESTDCLDLRTAGAESNVAVAAARLGTETSWLSSLPDSPLGRRVAGDIRRHGVDPVVAWDETGRQGVYYVEAGGAPRGTTVLYDRADSSVSAATPESLAVDGVAVADRLAAADWFFTTGITPALSDTLEATTRELLATETPTAFDLNYRRKLWSAAEARACYESLLTSVDLLFAPIRDLHHVLGLEGDAVDVARELRSTYDCETVVVTRGDAGAVAATADGIVEQPAFAAETADPIGTGDAFVGGYLSRIVRGDSVDTALEFGAATAALKRTVPGDLATVTEREVEQVLAGAGGDIDR